MTLKFIFFLILSFLDEYKRMIFYNLHKFMGIVCRAAPCQKKDYKSFKCPKSNFIHVLLEQPIFLYFVATPDAPPAASSDRDPVTAHRPDAPDRELQAKSPV